MSYDGSARLQPPPESRDWIPGRCCYRYELEEEEAARAAEDEEIDE